MPAFVNVSPSAKVTARESSSSGEADNNSIRPSKGSFRAVPTTTSPNPNALT